MEKIGDLVVEDSRDRFNNDSEETVDRQEIVNYVEMASLAFWDAYVKNESAGKTYLQRRV